MHGEIRLCPAFLDPQCTDPSAKLDQERMSAAGHAPIVAILFAARVWYARQSERSSFEATQMNKAFKIALLAGIFAVAIALFQQSENGRYQYALENEHDGIVLDTRTGEFWDASGTYYQPRARRITTHEPEIVDEAKGDERTNRFNECLKNHRDTPKNCLAELQSEIRRDITSVQRDLQSASQTDKTGKPDNEGWKIVSEEPANIPKK